MSDSESKAIRRRSVRGLAKLAIGAGLAVVCPPAAVGLAAVEAAKSLRKHARTGDPTDLADFVIAQGDLRQRK